MSEHQQKLYREVIAAKAHYDKASEEAQVYIVALRKAVTNKIATEHAFAASLVEDKFHVGDIIARVSSTGKNGKLVPVKRRAFMRIDHFEAELVEGPVAYFRVDAVGDAVNSNGVKLNREVKMWAYVNGKTTQWEVVK